jgi:iron(III) transport system substrate-binding protein
MMKRIVTVLLIMFFVVAAVEISSTTSASAVTSEIMEKAKKEGKVVWYTTMPGGGRKAVKKAFEKKYPLKLEMFQAGSLDIIGRYQAELSAKRVKVDCIHVADLVVYLDWLEQGNLMKYDSPEFAAYSGLPKGWVYPGYIYPVRVMPIGSVVNTKYVDWKSIKSYNDMLVPKFKGMIGAGDVATSTRAYSNYYGLRNKYGLGWYKKLVELDAQYYESSEKAMNKCLAGEWPILFEAWVYKGYQFRTKKKAPVRSIFPKEGSIVVPCPNAIMKQAPHPNAAKVFDEFLYSKEAQTILVGVLGVHSGRSDVSAPQGLPKVSEINVINIDFKEAKAKRKELVGEWRKISGR